MSLILKLKNSEDGYGHGQLIDSLKFKQNSSHLKL